MLRIEIPSTENNLVDRAQIDRYELPAPPNGTDTEINGNLILMFDDEEQAVAYLYALEDRAGNLSDDAPERPLFNTLISAISNDGFVQTYLS